MSAVSPSRREIRDWLARKVATELGGDTAIETDRPLAEYGLDSRSATGIAGDLEEWLGRELDPTIFFDYPTIDELAAFLETELPSDA